MIFDLINCLFCGGEIEKHQDAFDNHPCIYDCHTCGRVVLAEDAVHLFDNQAFNSHEKSILSIYSRNHPRQRQKNRKYIGWTLQDLHRIVKDYQQLDPIDKMDKVLLELDRLTETVGQRLKVYKADISRFHCKTFPELQALLHFLMEQEYIKVQDPVNPHAKLWLSAKGFQKLRDLRKVNKQSNICFVAMWFNPGEMGKVYEKAIKPAIEHREDESLEPRFKSIRIDNVEHINDINDEIIATIRRSRFMVCDLTGYRGGVYFEAGFAYGLGLPVIYTCRKDWTKEQILRTKSKKQVKDLYDENMKPIRIRKEGVHFDLAHMNRIEWEEDRLDDFRNTLENRIKAVIV